MYKPTNAVVEIRLKDVTDEVTPEMLSYAEAKQTRYDFFTTQDKCACTCCSYLKVEKDAINPCIRCVWSDE